MKKRLLHIAVLIISILFANSLIAQTFLVHKYTEEEGLPGSVVYSSAQSKEGFMFFTTRNGIARYDGLNWKNEWSEISREQADHSVLKLDNRGDLWLFSPYNSAFSKYENGDWQNITTLPQRYSKIYLQHYYSYAVGSQNNDVRILIYFDRKILAFFKDKKWVDLTYLLLETEIYQIEYYKDMFLLATSKGLLALGSNGKITQFNASIPTSPVLGFAVEYKPNQSDIIWILGNDFLGSFASNKYTSFLSNYNFDIFTIEQKITIIPNYYNSIILGSFNKILQIDKENKNVTTLGVVNGLLDGSPADLTLDRENNLWITSGRGISKISSMRFRNYNSYQGLLEDEVTSILQLNHKYYFGHNTGVSIMDKNNEVKPLLLPTESKFTRVLDMNISPFGEIYLATNGNGLCKINEQDKLVKIPLPYPATDVQSVVFDKSGTMFVSSIANIYSKSIASNNFKLFFKMKSQIRKLFIDGSNNIWAATLNDGVYKINQDGKLSHYKGRDTRLNNVYCINFNDPNKIILGTAKGLGIIRKDSIYSYNELAKIDNPVFLINKNKNIYWIGTDHGIYRIDNKQTRLYSVSDGLSGLETNRDAFLVDNNNDIWIGTNRGVSKYSAKFDNLEVNKPICRITGISQNDIFYDITKTILLPSNNKNTTFTIDVISFINERKNTYRYKLEGFESAWSKPQSIQNLEILYRNLPAGRYVLKVQSCNSLGTWSDVVSSPMIVVANPFYLSFGFIIFVLMILLLLIFVVVHFASEKKYRAKLEEEVNLRTDELAQSELRYKQMFIDNNAYMLIIDAQDGKIIDANPSAISYYGFQSKDLSCTFIFDLEVNKVSNKAEYLNDFNNSQVIALKHKLSDGTIRDVVAHLSILGTDNEKYIFAIIEDITDRITVEEQLKSLNLELEEIVKLRTLDLENALEDLKIEISIRKKTEEELFTANQKMFFSLEKERELGELKNKFISMISHEYRTPLTVILSSAYLVKESLKRGLNDEIDRHLYKIHASVTAMSRLLEDVLTYGKSEEGTLVIKPQPFEFARFMFDLIEEVKGIDQNKHEINFDYAGELPLFTDRYVLKQIFINLVHNATKFSDKGTSITIDLKVHQKEFSVIITDEGKGISDDDLSLIFNPFFRNEKTIGIIPGTGLGLTIVKRFIELLHGSIKVNNKIDKGVSFCITLPMKHSD